MLPLPGSVSARTNSLENLFIIGSGAILESDSLTINVDDSADGLFNSVIEVSGGTIRGEKLNIQISDNSTVIGLYIGKGTEAENIAIENSNPGKIDIDKNNNNSKDILNNITGNNPSIPQDDITTRFDAANAEDFFYNLFFRRYLSSVFPPVFYLLLFLPAETYRDQLRCIKETDIQRMSPQPSAYDHGPAVLLRHFA